MYMGKKLKSYQKKSKLINQLNKSTLFNLCKFILFFESPVLFCFILFLVTGSFNPLFSFEHKFVFMDFATFPINKFPTGGNNTFIVYVMFKGRLGSWIVSSIGAITTDLGQEYFAGKQLLICILKFCVILSLGFQVFNLMELVRMGQEVKW